MTYEKYCEDCLKFNLEPSMSETTFNNMNKEESNKREVLAVRPKRRDILVDEPIKRKRVYVKIAREKVISTRECLSEEQRKANKRAYNKRVADKNLALGLTALGKVRKRPTPKPREPNANKTLLTEEQKKERNRERARQWNRDNKERYNANKEKSRKNILANRNKGISVELHQAVTESN